MRAFCFSASVLCSLIDLRLGLPLSARTGMWVACLGKLHFRFQKNEGVK